MAKSKLQLLHRDITTKVLADLANAGCDPTLSASIADKVANTACDQIEDIMLARLQKSKHKADRDRGLDHV